MSPSEAFINDNDTDKTGNRNGEVTNALILVGERNGKNRFVDNINIYLREI
jgi:hypothetical protein